MNILISVDETYLKISKVMLFSLRCSTKQDICVYVLFQGNKDKFISFKKAMNKINIDIERVEFEDNITQGLKTIGHFTIAMYYRIFAHLLLPKNLERILYLDADLIVKKDISEFYKQDFKDKYMVVCEDINSMAGLYRELMRKLSISKEHKYFNSGVILMNLNKMRKDISKDTLAFYVNYAIDMQGIILNPDQDILNKLYENKVKYDDRNKYNMHLLKENNASKQQLEDAHIIHFIGAQKPWLYKGIISNISHYFWIFKCKMNKIYILEYIYTYLLGIIYNLYTKLKRL